MKKRWIAGLLLIALLTAMLPTNIVSAETNNTLTITEANELGVAQGAGNYTTESYYVTGVVTRVKNAMYGNIYIADENGNELYIHGVHDEAGNRYDAMDPCPIPGDTITVYGVVGTYDGVTAQMDEVVMTEYTPGTTESTDPEPDSFLYFPNAVMLGESKPDNVYTAGSYYITGIVTNVGNATYGNIDITDTEGIGYSIHLYTVYDSTGTVRYDQMTDQPAVGDLITVYGRVGNHNGDAQILNANVVERTAAADLAVVHYASSLGHAGLQYMTKGVPTALRLLVFVKYGYNFLGWATTPDATEPEYLPGDTVTLTEDLYLYAVWEQAPVLSAPEQSVTVYVENQYGYAGIDTMYQLNCTESGSYLFWGMEGSDGCDNWIALYDADGNPLGYDNDSGSDQQFRLEYYLTAGETYYVSVGGMNYDTRPFNFSISHGAQITYDANGGEGAPESHWVYYGDATTISATVPTRENYTFLGWATSADATEPEYQPGDSVTLTENLVLYAVWDSDCVAVYYHIYSDGEYHVAFEQYGNPGELIQLETVIPSGLGRNFCGWTADKNSTVADYQPGEEITLTEENLDLYAVYEIAKILNTPDTYLTEYTINRYGAGTWYQLDCDESGNYLLYGVGNDGSRTNQFIIRNDQNVNLAYGNDTVEYYFEAGTTYYVKTQLYDSATGYGVNEPFTFGISKAVCITYDANGGEGAPESLWVYSGEAFTINETAPTLEGYTFLGWATSPNAKEPEYQPGDIVTLTEDLYLYAVWGNITVIFDANGGEGAPEAIICAGSLTIPETVPTREGYTFLEWTDGNGFYCQPGDRLLIGGDWHFYAVWRGADTVTVTYDPVYFEATQTQEITKGVPTKLDKGFFYRFGYNFLGWNTVPDSETAIYHPDDTVTLTEDLYLYTVWAEAPVLSTPNTSLTETATFITNFSWYQLECTQSASYLFKSLNQNNEMGLWIDIYNAGGDLLIDNYGNNGDLEYSLTAGETYYILLYNNTNSNNFNFAICHGAQITYDANGGEGAPESHWGYSGDAPTISETVPTREGYNFLGWATSPDATEPEFQPGDTFTLDEDTTLYVVWEETKYTVTFDANGGEGAPEAIIHTGSLTIPETVPTREGYTFLEWTDSYGCDYQPGSRLLIGEDLYLYAVWGGADTVTITYDPVYFDATWTQKITKGVPTELDEGFVVRFGYDFLGWNTVPGAEAAIYHPCDTVTLTEDLYLYAVWAEPPVLSTPDTSLTETVTVRFSIYNSSWYQLECTQSASYLFKSLDQNEEIGTWIEIYNASGDLLIDARNNFDLEYSLTAGETYYINLGVSFYSNSNNFNFAICHGAQITYDANGGEGAPESHWVYSGDAPTISDVIPTREDSEFLGWATSPDATEPEYQPGDTYTANADVTLYAVWEQEETVLYGDVNSDGKVNAQDRLYLTRYLAGMTGYTEDMIDLIAADVNCDGKVNTQDRMILTRYLAQWTAYPALPHQS